MSAISITLPTIQITEYEPWPFLTVVNCNGKLYGIASDGVYQLEGDTDNGAQIVCNIETGTAQFTDSASGGNPINKIRPECLVYSGISTQVTNVNLIGDDSETNYIPKHNSTREKNRCRFGRGNTGFYWHTQVEGIAPFELYQLDLIGYETGRMV